MTSPKEKAMEGISIHDHDLYTYDCLLKRIDIAVQAQKKETAKEIIDNFRSFIDDFYPNTSDDEQTRRDLMNARCAIYTCINSVEEFLSGGEE